MPKEQKDIRAFMKQSLKKDAKYVKIKRSPEAVKFKLRLNKYLYTLVVKDKTKADKIAKSFPVGLKSIELDKKKKN